MKPIKNPLNTFKQLGLDMEKLNNYLFNVYGIYIISVDDYDITLGSCCGVADCNDLSEYLWMKGQDLTEYADIHTQNELLDYIVNSSNYKKYLCDEIIGKFTKSQLFAAIYSRFIIPIEYNYEMNHDEMGDNETDENETNEDETYYDKMEEIKLINIYTDKSFICFNVDIVSVDNTIIKIDSHDKSMNDIILEFSDKLDSVLLDLHYNYICKLQNEIPVFKALNELDDFLHKYILY